MKKAFLTGAASSLALLLAACGSNEDPVQNSDNLASAESANATMVDPNNPFAQSDMQMNERMMAAVGTDIGDSWVRKMIEHHQGAIDMSRVALQQNVRPDPAEMARMTIEKQGKEIEDLRKLLKEGSPNPQSSELYRPAMSQMHNAMMAAKGADVSETFLRKMLEHHRGAVAMSDIALRNGVSGTVRQQIQKTRDDQQKEVRMVEAMLRGETMSQAMQQPDAKPAEQPKPQPASAAAAPAAKKSAPAEPAKPAAETTPKAAPKPAPPAPTCSPEHRAMGHC